MLEFGVGFCQIRARLADTQPVICVALDLFYDYLAMSRARWSSRRTESVPSRLACLHGDGEQPGIRTGTTDAVVAWANLHLIPNLSTVVAELHRNLNRGGRCLFVEPNSLSPARKATEMCIQMRYGMAKQASIRASWVRCSSAAAST